MKTSHRDTEKTKAQTRKEIRGQRVLGSLHFPPLMFCLLCASVSLWLILFYFYSASNRTRSIRIVSLILAPAAAS